MRHGGVRFALSLSRVRAGRGAEAVARVARHLDGVGPGRWHRVLTTIGFDGVGHAPVPTGVPSLADMDAGALRAALTGALGRPAEAARGGGARRSAEDVRRLVARLDAEPQVERLAKGPRFEAICGSVLTGLEPSALRAARAAYVADIGWDEEPAFVTLLAATAPGLAEPGALTALERSCAAHRPAGGARSFPFVAAAAHPASPVLELGGEGARFYVLAEVAEPGRRLDAAAAVTGSE